VPRRVTPRLPSRCDAAFHALRRSQQVERDVVREEQLLGRIVQSNRTFVFSEGCGPVTLILDLPVGCRSGEGSGCIDHAFADAPPVGYADQAAKVLSVLAMCDATLAVQDFAATAWRRDGIEP